MDNDYDPDKGWKTVKDWNMQTSKHVITNEQKLAVLVDLYKPKALPEMLQRELYKVLKKENYEYAAILRDKINELNK